MVTVVLATIAGHVKELNDRLRTEIAERRRAEENERGMAAEWELTFNSITRAVSIIDATHTIRRVNAAFSKMADLPPEQIIGKHCYRVIHHTDRPWPTCPHRRMMETNSMGELRNGTRLPVTRST